MKNAQKKVIVSSFMGSGSSAITDLLSEYSNVMCKNGDFEYVFLHCPDGMFDLEDKLLLGNNICRSDEALRKFEKAMNELYLNKNWWFGNYKNKVSESFIKVISDYLREITEFNFTGYWYEHEKNNIIKCKINLCISIFNHVFKSNIEKIRVYDDKMKISFIKAEKFYQCSRNMLNNFFDLLTEEDEEAVILMDQLLLPHNLHRAVNYFDDSTKIIVVHRDPRDVFLLNKYVWMPKSMGVPFPTNVDDFCLFYDKMMKSIKNYKNNVNILDIRFEDLIYDYDNIVSKLEEFTGLNSNDHLNKFLYFNPKISQENTNLRFELDISEKEKNIIKEKLSEYVYDFKEDKVSTKITKVF